MTDLPVIERTSNSSAEVNASIIWLHGLGADGGDFAPIVSHLGLPASYAVRFVFPSAPSIAVTINQGMVMPAWYDILELGSARCHDETGLLASAGKVQALLRREIDRGVPSERILLAGFSQGGAVCLEAGLSFQCRLGGIIALSTYFPTAASVVVHPEQCRSSRTGLPRFDGPVVGRIPGAQRIRIPQAIGPGSGIPCVSHGARGFSTGNRPDRPDGSAPYWGTERRAYSGGALEVFGFNSPVQTLINFTQRYPPELAMAASSGRSLTMRATAAAGMNTGAWEPKSS